MTNQPPLLPELDRGQARAIAAEALQDADDGELFVEYRQSETLVFDDGQLKNASFDTSQGFGLRSTKGETTGYAHSSEISDAALRRAAKTVQSIRETGGRHAVPPRKTNRQRYGDANPIDELPFDRKVALLTGADAYARSLDPRVKQVSVSLSGEWQFVEVIRPDGFTARDIRPLVRFNVSVVTAEGARRESGSYGFGGRASYSHLIGSEQCQFAVREALRQSVVSLTAVAAPAGEMDVVLGAGWPGILLHEAIGHGLEGDFNRKQTSAFANLMGQRIASDEVTVVDDGTIEDRRGSLSIDDEGTPSRRNVLIENGILVGYMQDRLNARLMGAEPTGNGRRQSYAHAPMPRMTNTFMLDGKHHPQEIIESVSSGLYAVNFGGGQVDITSGKFVFHCTEAYRLENGKIGAPVKGAMIIGSGADALKRISMVGNDMKLDPGIGTCGKQGQGVPVGVGQPTLRLNRITVGGTAK
jgi:TldD protein